jgi:hypothetical protein
MINIDEKDGSLTMDCECGEKFCNGYIGFQKDGNGIMVYVDSGDDSGTIWLSVGQLKELIKSLDDFVFFLGRGG